MLCYFVMNLISNRISHFCWSCHEKANISYDDRMILVTLSNWYCIETPLNLLDCSFNEVIVVLLGFNKTIVFTIIPCTIMVYIKLPLNLINIDGVGWFTWYWCHPTVSCQFRTLLAKSNGHFCSKSKFTWKSFWINMNFGMYMLGIVEQYLINFIEFGHIFIACKTLKLGTEGIWEIKFQTKQVHGSI